MSDGDKSLERRIKKVVHGRPHKLVLRFPKGTGDLLLAEVQAALATPLYREKNAPKATLGDNSVTVDDVSFREMAGLVLRLTVAREALWVLCTKTHVSAKAKFKEVVAEIPWALYLPPGSTVALRVTSTASRLYHESMLKELASEAFAKVGLVLGSVADADFTVDLRLVKDRLTTSLALTTAPLHRRHYKIAMRGTASVKEDLAAAAVRHALGDADTRRYASVYVPFAGSGTLAFEAVLRLAGMPPAVFLPPLAVERLVCMPPATATFLRRKLVERWRDAAVELPTLRLVERDAEQVKALLTNCDHFNAVTVAAGGRPVPFEVVHGDAMRADLWPKRDALVLLNPPYGDRLQGEADLYREIGELLATSANDGVAFVPDARAETKLTRPTGSTPALSWSSRPVSHGGRPIRLTSFRPG